ncbi:hypothetical protein RRG08_018856 [Elysia crispata]|uniref:Uncharacterized protein n=1 Tax=Elysia crispata TaxID=231223 RepID=A0AAE1B7E1_9GAST|nr:hypothetical protein RRG08_018856 [Elysia crispata]
MLNITVRNLHKTNPKSLDSANKQGGYWFGQVQQVQLMVALDFILVSMAALYRQQMTTTVRTGWPVSRF